MLNVTQAAEEIEYLRPLSSIAEYAHHHSKGKWLRLRHAVATLDYIQYKLMLGNARIILNEPPRHGKSERLCFWTPAWILDLFPEWLVMFCMYGETTARRYARRVRDHLEHKGQIKIRRDARVANHWHTEQGGGMIAAGIGGPITGIGADLLILDDPYKNFKEATSMAYKNELENWMSSTFLTRGQPGASVIVSHTRWVSHDLTNHLLEETDGNWELIKLPALANDPNDWLGREVGEALAPALFTRESILKRKNDVGHRTFQTMYQQSPDRESVTTLFRAPWINENRINQVSLAEMKDIVIATDIANTSKPTGSKYGICVCAQGYNNHYYLLKSEGVHISPEQCIKRLRDLFYEYGASLVIYEDNSAKDWIKSTINQVWPDAPMKAVTSIHSKRIRATPIGVLYEQNKVHHVGHFESLESEMLLFPDEHQYDDEIDAMVHGFRYLSKMDNLDYKDLMGIGNQSKQQNPWRV